MDRFQNILSTRTDEPLIGNSEDIQSIRKPVDIEISAYGRCCGELETEKYLVAAPRIIAPQAIE
jgi:hypothetical protein